MSKRAAVWIDHKEAHVFSISLDVANELMISAPHDLHHKHARGPEGVKNHPDDAKRFFHEVLRSLEAVEQVLLVGPSSAKKEFLKYVQAHAPALGAKVIGVETVDHPTDGQLIAYAKKYFARVERAPSISATNALVPRAIRAPRR